MTDSDDTSALGFTNPDTGEPFRDPWWKITGDAYYHYFSIFKRGQPLEDRDLMAVRHERCDSYRAAAEQIGCEVDLIEWFEQIGCMVQNFDLYLRLVEYYGAPARGKFADVKRYHRWLAVFADLGERDWREKARKCRHLYHQIEEEEEGGGGRS